MVKLSGVHQAMAVEKQMCWCFPAQAMLAKEYTKHLNDRYLAEKTKDTVTEWLADKQVISFNAVVLYAQDDYEEYVCSRGSSGGCASAKMSSAINEAKINKALQAIAKPCYCDPK